MNYIIEIADLKTCSSDKPGSISRIFRTVDMVTADSTYQMLHCVSMSQNRMWNLPNFAPIYGRYHRS